MFGNDPAGGTAPDSAPLILIVQAKEWTARALESILIPAGYECVRSPNGRLGLERARALRPAAIFVDLELVDMAGLDVLRALKTEAGIDDSTPIIATTSEAPTRDRRLEALGAGAWEFVPLPPDTPELLARLSTWIRAQRYARAAGNAGLLDVETGLYNAQGLARRAEELAAEARRFERPLAAVVFTLQPPSGFEGDEATLLTQVRDALRGSLRTCDALGRISPRQLAVLAPATAATGALRLAERALEALSQAGHDSEPLRLDVLAGYYGVENYRDAQVRPGELLERAATASLHLHSSATGGQWIRPARSTDTLN